jgi:hypothetical protein
MIRLFQTMSGHIVRSDADTHDRPRLGALLGLTTNGDRIRTFLCCYSVDMREPRPTNHQSPITNHQSPITNHQSPITNHQSPITNHQSPITFHQSPFTNHLSPITFHQSPFTFHFFAPSVPRPHHHTCRVVSNTSIIRGRSRVGRRLIF